MSRRELVDLSFEEWLIWVFAHPATGPEWHFDVMADWWNEDRDPSLTAGYLTRLFEDPGVLLPAYSDAQIDRGLNFLISSACSNHFFALFDEAVPWPKRERGLRAIAILFRELYAVRCTVHFGHLESVLPGKAALNRALAGQWPHLFGRLDIGPEPPNPLNGTCYMWWDICPLPYPFRTPQARATLSVVLDVLQETLRLPSPACQEGALHGLGHLQSDAPVEVQRIIDDYLRQKAGVHPALRDYARRAQSGSVL